MLCYFEFKSSYTCESYRLYESIYLVRVWQYQQLEPCQAPYGPCCMLLEIVVTHRRICKCSCICTIYFCGFDEPVPRPYFTSAFLDTWNWMPSRLKMSWNGLLKKFFSLCVFTQTGHLRMCLKYLGLLRTDLNADVTEGTVFDFRNNFENTSKTIKTCYHRYIYWAPARQRKHIPKNP